MSCSSSCSSSLSESLSDSSSTSNSWTSEDSSISAFITDSDSDSDVESSDVIGLGQARQLERSTNSLDLYERAHVSVLEYCFLVMQYALRFNLSGAATEALLKLLKCLLPKPNRSVQSLYSLRKQILSRLPHYQPRLVSYCSQCTRLLDCERACHGKENVHEFVVVDIRAQLVNMFKDREFWGYLQTRRGSSTSRVSDIYDGLVYRTYASTGGFLDKSKFPAHISLLLNTDGVSIYKSSKISIWPVYLVINELPLHVRFSKRFAILCAIWYDKEKPSMYTVLRPIIDQVNELHNEGVWVDTPSGRSLCRCVLICCSVDLPARALVCNMKSFNGEHGCCTCEDKGDNTVTSHPMHRIWPYTNPNTVRTTDGVREAYITATETSTATMGYKGVPILALHPPFDLVRGMVADYMHCVTLGVAKQLTRFWFDSAYRRKPFSICNQRMECDSRLLKIEVPTFVKRIPRKLEDRAQWKASEYQNWLLLYCLPVLKDFLLEAHYVHLQKLVSGLSLLLSSDIDALQLQRANFLLDSFCEDMESLYGPLSQTMNVHQLRHLSFHVNNFGPLWAFSCFSFEARNGDIRKLFHGTRNMSQQVTFSYVMEQSLDDFPVSSFVRTSLSRILGLTDTRHSQALGENIWQLGYSEPLEDSDPIRAALPSTIHNPVKFFRLKRGKRVYSSLRHRNAKKRNNHTISYRMDPPYSECFGQIIYFVHCQNPFRILVIVKKLEIVDQANLPNTIKRVSVSEQLNIISLNEVMDQYSFLNFSPCTCYVARFPCHAVPLLDVF